ncbi:hypothetical protein ACKKBF_B09985 [Auxenochlorella protothecoides x Auxenochlorella symbiontica]
MRGSMPPPSPRAPRRREAVLEEDEWVARAEAIIERDFFPELSKLEGKVQWLEAVRSGDPARMREAQVAFAARRAGLRPGTSTGAGPLFTPGGTGARVLAGDLPTPTGDLSTPVTLHGGAGGARAASGAAQAPAMSLDAFMRAHTSEDNASFAALLATENGRRTEAYAAIAAPPGSGEQAIKSAAGPRPTDGFGTGGQPSDRLVQWRYEPRNALMYDGSQRDALALSDKERAAQVQGPPKAIKHRNTRFPGPQALSSCGDTTPASSATGTQPGSPGSLHGAAFVGVDGLSYPVLATPSFDPGEATPFMTWGDIQATPLRIEAEDLPAGDLNAGAAKFHIRESSAREQTGRDLAQRSAPAAGGRAGAPPRPSGALARLVAQRTPGPRRGAATPLSGAARRLAGSLGGAGGKRPRPGEHRDAALRASYAGLARPPSTGHRGGWGSAAATPAATPLRHEVPEANRAGGDRAAAGRTGNEASPAPGSHVTDGLLHI